MHIHFSWLILVCFLTLLGCRDQNAEHSVKTAYVPITHANLQPYFTAKRCINMGNALEADQEGDWGYKIQADHFRIIRDAGFDTVRIPIKWSAHTASYPPYRIDPQFMNRIIAVVRQAQSQGLGVIIDVHHYTDLLNHPSRETPRYLAIWDQIARTFARAPTNVYFEILNEPHDPLTASQASRLYQQVIPVIRASNPTRPIILGGDGWNSVDRLDDISWPKDPYLVATFHDYGPHTFTHQGASWMTPPPPTGRRWGTAEDKLDLVNTYQMARQFRAKTGLPVFVGEFGVIDTVSDRERAYWIKTRRQQMERDGFSWCVWDFSGAFKIYDLQNRRWRPGMKDALTGH